MPAFKSLHSLKIKERIDYKIIYFAYDIFRTSQPQYLRKRINIIPTDSTRSSDHLTLLFTSTSSRKISNRSFNRTTYALE